MIYEACVASAPATAQLAWASPDGTTVLGILDYPGHSLFGLFSKGTFHALPSPPAGISLPSIALYPPEEHSLAAVGDQARYGRPATQPFARPAARKYRHNSEENSSLASVIASHRRAYGHHRVAASG
jgi:hypothetical protein